MGAPGGKINRPRTVTLWERCLCFASGPEPSNLARDWIDRPESPVREVLGRAVRGLRLISIFLPCRS